jgi:hypothetical protein
MKRRTGLYFAGVLAALMMAAAVAIAAVPRTISYQGYLTDSGGTPVDGTVQMQFKLYSAASGGVPLWAETHQNVQVSQGRYSVVLGNASPTPVPIDLPFDVPYYLGVTVGSDAEMTPRLPLTSTGYAFHAAQADGLSSASTLSVANTIVSTVPTGEPPLQVASTTMVQNLNAEMVGGMHATDFVARSGDTMTGSLTVPSISLTGILTLPTTSSTAGIIMQGGNRLIHTYGVGNFFAGTNAGMTIEATGRPNTGIGYEALKSLTTGALNTAVGTQALYSSTTGYGNTATGVGTLASNTTGYHNTAAGALSLVSNTTGTSNTAIGYFSLYDNTTGYSNTASGMDALETNTTGVENTASGYYALSGNKTGGQNTAIGTQALINNRTGSYNTAIGVNADTASGDLHNATAIGHSAIVDNSNTVRIGNTDVTHIGGQVGFSNDSDVREKKDIQDIGYGLGFIKQLRPVQYRMKNGNDRIDFGFIAQDIELTLGTEYNILGIGKTEDRMLSLRYTDFIAPMVKAMQEQQLIIEKQQALIDALMSRLAEVEAKLSGRP